LGGQDCNLLLQPIWLLVVAAAVAQMKVAAVALAVTEQAHYL
jgi:hypothetical protein